MPGPRDLRLRDTIDEVVKDLMVVSQKSQLLDNGQLHDVEGYVLMLAVNMRTIAANAGIQLPSGKGAPCLKQ